MRFVNTTPLAKFHTLRPAFLCLRSTNLCHARDMFKLEEHSVPDDWNTRPLPLLVAYQELEFETVYLLICSQDEEFCISSARGQLVYETGETYITHLLLSSDRSCACSPRLVLSSVFRYRRGLAQALTDQHRDRCHSYDDVLLRWWWRVVPW